MKTHSKLLTHRLVATLAILSMLVLVACSPTPPPSPTPAPAAKLVFTTQPTAAVAGQAFTTQPVVVVQDANGKTVTRFNGLVSLTITSGTGTSEARIFGGTRLMASNGIATFTALSINKAGTGYTLTATSPDLPPATSAPFNVSPGPAAQLVFTRGVVTTQAGTVFSVQPVVEVQDAEGNLVPDYSAPIILGLRYDRAPLLGTATARPVNGIATFSGLYVNKAGDAYALAASSGGLILGFSENFNVTPASAVKLAFTTQPETAAAGVTFDTAPIVAVQDTYGNAVTGSTATVSLAIAAGTGSPGAVLSGETKVKVERGEAYFSGLAIDKAGTGYTLTATSPDLPPVVSTPFNVAPMR